jgi:hypothetical protein
MKEPCGFDHDLLDTPISMHNKSVFTLPRVLRAVFCAAALALLAGCDIKMTDLTPKVLPENPSRIYTFALNVTPKTTKVVRDSFQAHLVIDGQILEMKTGTLGNGVFEYEYQLPAGRDEVAYYYIVDYAVRNDAGISRRQGFTDITRAQVVGRYVLTMETNRGPVGARISVVGRGFGSADIIKFDGEPVRTVNESSNALSFFVPAVETGRNYRVTLEGAAGSSPVGTFRVDPAILDVSPARISLTEGGIQPVTFTIPAPASAGGQLLDVTTDIPDSVIMPEVIVPEGRNSVIIDVRGGKPGTGNLFLKGYGTTGEIIIPVVVQ